jgi:DNA end-binding protein Ku
MARSMWRGAISFGMVAIPVRMYLATESKSVSFRLLCPSCHRPIRNKRFCPHENIEVAWNDTVRGYEVSKDEFVPIDDSDLDRLPLPTSQAIEILEFVDDAEIDAGVYLKQAYYLEPEKVGQKPYELLRRALEKTGRVAVGRLALRDREHLVRLAIHGEHGILLNTLHWPDEIRATEELSLPSDDVEVAKGELDMAVMLIDNLAAGFDPARFQDRYREALLEVVEEKLGKQEIRRPAPEEPPKVMDLMAALKASVEAAQRREGAEGEEPAAASATATAARRARGSARPAEPARRRKTA